MYLKTYQKFLGDMVDILRFTAVADFFSLDNPRKYGFSESFNQQILYNICEAMRSVIFLRAGSLFYVVHNSSVPSSFALRC